MGKGEGKDGRGGDRYRCGEGRDIEKKWREEKGEGRERRGE